VVIKQLAAAVKAKGIKTIDGRVLIDPGFLGDGPTENGTGTTMSAVVVNDNVIDLVLKPGAKAGDPVVFESSPHTSYINFINNLSTTAAGTSAKLGQPAQTIAPDGTVTVPLNGSMPVGMPAITYAFAVPSPVKFAARVWREALTAEGMRIKNPAKAVDVDLAELAKHYTDENQVAEHISPPFSEAIKVTLKVSENLPRELRPLSSRLSGGQRQEPPVPRGLCCGARIPARGCQTRFVGRLAGRRRGWRTRRLLQP